MSVNRATDPAGAAAFSAAQRVVTFARQAFRQEPLSVFVRAMRGAIQQYLDARAQGVSRDDGARGLEEELRTAWPKTVSKFRPACDACDDTGWVEHWCWDQHRCGREVCAKNPDRQHRYVEPCYCPKGDRCRPRVKTPIDEIAAVGKTQPKKRGGWSRAGV